MLTTMGAILVGLAAIVGAVTQVRRNPRSLKNTDYLGVRQRNGKPHPYRYPYRHWDSSAAARQQAYDCFVHPGQFLWRLWPWESIRPVKWRGLTTEEKSIPVTLGKGQVWLAMSILTYDLSWSGVLRAVEEAGENSSKIITQLFLDLVGDVLIDQGSGAEREVLRKEIRRRAEEHPELLAWGVIPRGITLVELAPAPSTQMTDAGREIFGTK